MEEEVKNIVDSAELDNEKYSLYSDFLPSDGTEELNLRYGFEIGGVEFLVRENQLSEIVRSPKVFPIPNAPTSVQGLINHRGNLVPLFKFKSFVCSGHDEMLVTNNDYVLVLDKGEKATAFDIDKIPFTINVEDDSFLKLDQSIEELSKVTGQFIDFDDVKDNEFLEPKKNIKNISDSAMQFIDSVYEYKHRLFIDFDFERFFNEITSN